MSQAGKGEVLGIKPDSFHYVYIFWKKEPLNCIKCVLKEKDICSGYRADVGDAVIDLGPSQGFVDIIMSNQTECNVPEIIKTRFGTQKTDRKG